MADKLQILIEINAKIDKLNKTIDGVRRLSAQVDSFGKKTKKTEQDLASLNKKFASLTKSVTGLIAAYASFQGAKAFVGMVGDIEEGFVGVAKTTGLAGEQFNQFKDQIKDMSVNLAGVSINELQSIAQTAGQLGIQGADDLSRFTETIAKIAIATDLTADESANAFARLTNILGEPISEVERMGSVVNELSNTSTATAHDITEFALRVGGAGRTFGLTTDEIFAFSASLKDAGLNAELGGTNFSKFLSEVLSNIQGFSDFVGQDIYAFSEALQNEPVKAIEAILQKFKELDKTAKIQALDDLNLTGSEMQRTMFALSDSLDKVQKNLKTASTEWKDNTSLQKEYETASQSLNAKLEQLNNAFVVMMNEIGEGLLPAIKDAVEGMTEFGKSIDKEALNEFGQAIGDIVGLIGELVKMAVEFYGANSEIINTTAKVAIAMMALNKAVNAGTVAMAAFISVATVLGTLMPLLAAALSVVNAVDKIQEAVAQWKEFHKTLDKSNDTVEQSIELLQLQADSLAASEITKAQSDMSALIAKNEEYIASLKAQIAAKEEELWITDEEQKMIDSMKIEVATLTSIKFQYISCNR